MGTITNFKAAPSAFRRSALALTVLLLFLALTNIEPRAQGADDDLGSDSPRIVAGVFDPDSAKGPNGAPVLRKYFQDLQHAADQQQVNVIAGAPGWLFFAPELRAISSGPFWGPGAAATSRSSNPKFADPLEPILDFHSQLKSAGIDLWLVPVPAKASIYPELTGSAVPLPSRPHATNDRGGPDGPVRIDTSHVAFYQLLRDKGLTVIDLTEQYFQQKSRAQEPLFCQTDSHWSGRGVEVAATALAEMAKKKAWYPSLAKIRFLTEPISIEIIGDLAQLRDEKSPAKEKIKLTRVMELIAGQPRTVADDPQSPVLLLGDSHTLIFHDPTLHAEGCGLADHLADRLGLRVDVIGVRGSGANAARLNWRRRMDPLTGKQLVIWCFSMREFTENTDGWRKIPIAKSPAP